MGAIAFSPFRRRRGDAMSENPSGLPRFPGEESRRYEESLRRRPDPPDHLSDQLRYAWPVYAAIVGLLGLWAIFAIALLLAVPSWTTVAFVLALPLLAAVWIAMRRSMIRRLRGWDD